MDLKRNRTRVKAPAFIRPISLPTDPSVGNLMTNAAQSLGTDQRHLRDGTVPTQLARRSNLPDLRGGLRLASWNVTTLSNTGYQSALCRELQRFQISIAGICEARIPGSGSYRVENSLLLHSGGTQRSHGVALIISQPFINTLQTWTPISDRLLQARLSHRHGHITVFVAYAPTEVAEDDDKDVFYNQLSAAVSSVPPHDVLVILGDFNAVTGHASDNSGVVGPFCSGEPNDNSDRLLSLCSINGLTILGSWFRRLDIHRWTWLSHDGHTKKEIDHILTRQRDRQLFKSLRVFRSLECPANTDHMPVVSSLAIKLMRPKKDRNLPSSFNVLRLSEDTELQKKYNLAVTNKFNCLLDLPEDVDVRWSALHTAILESANEVIGPRHHKRQPWLSEDTFDIIRQKSTARLRNNRTEHKRLCGVFKAKAKEDRIRYLTRMADETEEDFRHNRTRSVFKAIKILAGGNRSSPPLCIINKSDNSPCNSIDEALQCWNEHFSAILNLPPGIPSCDLDTEASVTSPDPDVNTDEPSLEEVVAAIKKLRNGRAAGPDGIPPELLKCALTPVSSALHSLFTQVWRSGRVPADWKDGIIVTLYKGKGSRTDCGNYRPITLLSVPGKVFAHVLLARIEPLLIKTRRPQQSGFTPGRSTIDAILALRLLSELHREFDRPLNVAYLDIKSAFDSVDRAALWKALRSKGVPDNLLQLIATLHQNTCASVRVGHDLSTSFQTSSGVRQGCVLAPALFCVAMDWILGHMSSTTGINVGLHHFSDLVYADDTTLLLPPDDDVISYLSAFSYAAAPLGLRASWTKTKLQNLGPGHMPSPISIDGVKIDSTESFMYLGSIQSSNGYCSEDIKRRICLASSTMFSLSRIWKDKRLSDTLKIRLYQSLVLSTLLYSAETWTLLSENLRSLEAFHTKCLRMIFGIRWYDYVTNISILARAALPPLADMISGRRLAIFGHVARLDDTVPAKQILRCHVDLSSGRRPDTSWRRPRGRPRNRWIDQLRRDTNIPPATLWRNAILRGHGSGRRYGPLLATRT